VKVGVIGTGMVVYAMSVMLGIVYLMTATPDLSKSLVAIATSAAFALL